MNVNGRRTDAIRSNEGHARAAAAATRRLGRCQRRRLGRVFLGSRRLGRLGRRLGLRRRLRLSSGVGLGRRARGARLEVLIERGALERDPFVHSEPQAARRRRGTQLTSDRAQRRTPSEQQQASRLREQRWQQVGAEAVAQVGRGGDHDLGRRQFGELFEAVAGVNVLQIERILAPRVERLHGLIT